MGKRKTKIKFIDKKQSLSFHLVAKASGGHDGVDDIDEEREELDRELAEQKAERRRKLGLEPHEEMKGEEEEEDDEDDEEEEDDDEEEGDAEEEDGENSFIPKPASDDRIDLLNMAAAAEGIETRAVRQARKAAKEAKPTQQFYLQPNFKPGSNVQIPKDFPQEVLYMGNGEDADDEYWEKQDQQKYELQLQASAPSLFPHNYDYEKHLRPMTGRGVFMEAKRGDDEYDPETDLRFQPAPASSSSTSTNPTEEAPADPSLLASVEAYQRSLLRSGRRMKPTKDFVKALEGEEQEEEFEELQDDFVIQAMMGGGTEDAGDEEGEFYEDGEGYYEEYYEEEEEYEEQGEDEKDEDGDDIPRTLTQKPKRSRKPAADEYDEDGDHDDQFGDDDGEMQGDELDAAFDKVLEEYDDEEIGELDHYMDEDPSALEGNLDLEQVESVMDDFLTQKDKFKSEGGSIIDNVEKDLKELTLSKLALVTAGEKSLNEIEQDLDNMLQRPVKETWDAESILSTYSNTDNHPRVLREHRRSKAGSKAPSEAGGSSRSAIAPFQPALPVPAAILRQAKIDAGEEVDDEDEIDEEEEEEEDQRENKGKARAQFETPEEKKARKQAVKQAQREAKERKKALKTLYVKETSAAIAKQAKLNKINPPGVRKL